MSTSIDQSGLVVASDYVSLATTLKIESSYLKDTITGAKHLLHPKAFNLLINLKPGIELKMLRELGEKQHLRPEELNDQFRGVIIPADPETEANYEYRAKAPLSFELCATFNRSSGDKFPKATPAMPFTSIKPVPAEGGLFVFGGITAWGHPAGRFCFERTIDKDFFLSPEKR